MFRATNIYESLIPIYVCSKVFAFWCMKISKQRFSTSRMGYIFTTVLVVFYIYISFPRIYLNLNDIRRNKLQNFVSNATVIIICMSGIVILLHGMLFCNKIIGWIDNVNEFDKEMLTSMNRFSFKRSHQKVKFYSTVSSVLMIIFFISSEIVYGYIRLENDNRKLFTYASNILMFSLPAIIANVFILILSTKIFILKERFTLINIELSRLSKQWHINYPKLKKHRIESISKQFDYQYNEGVVISVLEKLRLSYCRLENLKQDLISIYSFPLLITVLRIFLYPLGYILGCMEWCADFSFFGILTNLVARLFANTFHILALSCIGTWTSKEIRDELYNKESDKNNTRSFTNICVEDD